MTKRSAPRRDSNLGPGMARKRHSFQAGKARAVTTITSIRYKVGPLPFLYTRPTAPGYLGTKE